MTAKEYHDKEYGEGHMKMICDMDDYVSLFAFCDEYAEWRIKQERLRVRPQTDLKDEFDEF